MTMKSIWVIEQGTYSDYHVAGVFSRKENADLVCEALKASEPYDEPVVNEWFLDPAVKELNSGMDQYLVLMLKDGTVERAEQVGFGPYALAGEVVIWRRSQAQAYRGKGIPDCLNARVWAKDKKHAIKIVNEHRAQMIAEGMF